MRNPKETPTTTRRTDVGRLPRVLPRVAMLGAVAIALVFLVGAGQPLVHAPVAVSAPTGGASWLGSPAVKASAPAPATAVPSTSTTPAPTPPANGPAVFFNNTIFANLPPGAPSVCANTTYNPRCWDSTSEPSMNLTSAGVLAVAYTAFTNATDCPQFLGNGSGTTEVAIRTTTDFGLTWSLPTYYNNPICNGTDGNYSSSAQPSLTSLPNGTLVMTFEEYNITTCSYSWCYRNVAPDFWTDQLTYDRIVVTESYDNGTTWTTPVVLDSVTSNPYQYYEMDGYPDLMPRIASSGETVYVAWTNYTVTDDCDPMMEITVRASTDGGATWGSPNEVPPMLGTGNSCNGDTSSAFNPDLVVVPNGTLYVGYVTKYIDLCLPNWCGPAGSIAVAWSTDNATTFSSVEVAADQSFLYDWDGDGDTIPTAVPSMAYDPSSGDLYIAWNAEEMGTYCHMYDPTDDYCGYDGALVPFIAKSLNGGTTWSWWMVNASFVNPNGGLYNQAYMPTIAVTTDGTVHMDVTYMNDSVCNGPSGGCGAMQELYLNSSDGGVTWMSPILVSSNFTSYDLYETHLGWIGDYASILPVGTDVYLGWTMANCYSSYCDWQWSTPAVTSVVFSTVYRGPGVTLTFTESGLPTGAMWSAEVMGNYRVGTAPQTLSVSGIPPADIVAFSIPWYNETWGVSYYDTYTPTSPTSFLTSTTIAATFTEQVLMTIQTIPAFPYYYWTSSGADSNYMISPAPGSYWVAVGTVQAISVMNVPFSAYCDCWNLSFQSWTGSGPGNYTGLSGNISITVTAPINETANFLVLGYCWSYSNLCWSSSYYPETFAETGLPANVPWSVTMLFANGTVDTNTTDAPVRLGFLIPETPSSFYVWSVPDPATGEVWVPSTDATSPVRPITNPTVHVTFTLEDPSDATFSTRFVEEGLPAGTAWSLELGSQSLGIETDSTFLPLWGGGPYSVNASPVYLENGYGYVASSVTYTSYVFNESETTQSAPAALFVNGSGVVTIEFTPIFLLTTFASVGGTVSPATGWFAAGAHVQLNETPSSGFHFVSWLGAGSGATTTAQNSLPNPVITPGGPVTETATFRPNPLPTYNVTVVPVGLPAGQTVMLTVGSENFAGVGNFTVGPFYAGEYPVSVAYAYLNGSQSTRYVPTDISSDLGLSSDVLSVNANGTLTVTYGTEYLLSVAATPAVGGTVSPAPGAYWEVAGTSVPLAATPAAGYQFVGWNGTATGVVLTPSTSVSMTNPWVVTAQFSVRPAPPVVSFSATITETGLPTNTGWGFSLGTFGAAGTNGTLTALGLNGTYNLTIGTVTISPGVRWVPDVVPSTETIHANWSFTVNFTEQFLVTVVAGAGGFATPAGGTWVAAGGQLSLLALPNGTGMTFSNWTGVGTGSYSGTSAAPTLTVNGPITEQASFVEVVKVSVGPAPSTTGGMSVALGLLVGLLAVGFVAGYLLRRGRGGRPATPVEGEGAPEWAESPEPTLPSDYTETPETTENPP